LESEAIESGQVHFEHDARRAGVRHAHQILLGAGEELDGVALPRQQIGEACPGRRVIIHYEDAGF
jgi:hypothetical protein